VVENELEGQHRRVGRCSSILRRKIETTWALVLGGLTVWGSDDGFDKKGRDFDRVEPLARDSVPAEYVLPIFLCQWLST
jgi:hypothetical protein